MIAGKMIKLIATNLTGEVYLRTCPMSGWCLIRAFTPAPW